MVPRSAPKVSKAASRQRTVCRHGEDGLFGDRDRIPQLRLAHPQRVLLVTMVDFVAQRSK